MKAYAQAPAHQINYSENNRRPWTQEDIAKALQMRSEGIPYTKIARELKRRHYGICRIFAMHSKK